MKAIKTKDIKTKTGADLEKMLADKRGELRAFRFGTAGSKEKNVKAGKSARKDIARILTVLNTKKGD
ncbi:MAG: 50S ribosomal protein L29 [Patescibacteria group bacterium]|nr:50S ribosomal protein L29 [Patescibacteria group bacterium]